MELIRKQPLLFLLSLLLNGCNSTGLPLGDYMKDEDWNTRFSSNCPLPHYDSIRWMSENNRRYARFTLSDKDKGGCSTDGTARHSAPYWERAELKQSGTLGTNKLYTIDVTLRFVEGFSGERETFFQIHAYNNSCKQAYPPIMLKFDNTHTATAALTLLALQSSKRHNSYRSDLRIQDVLGDWINLKLILDTSSDGNIAVSVDGETLFSDIPFWIEPCGIPYIKFGAYRPGSALGNVRSIVDFDSINVN